MKSDCIFMGMMAIVLAIPFFICLFKIVLGRFDKDDLPLGLVSLLYSVIFGFGFYVSLTSYTAPPIVSSCTSVVTPQGDTLYKLCDSTRYCKRHIEEDEVSTRCTTTKKDASAGLLSTDTCEICDCPLCEHWKSQSVGYDGSDIPAW